MNKWISDRHIYLTEKGQVCEANDPRKHTLLVATGGSIDLAVAERLGLSKVRTVPAAVIAQYAKPDFDTMKKSELGLFLMERSMEFDSKLNRADLIELCKAALEEKA